MQYEQREIPLGDFRQTKFKKPANRWGPKYLRANFDIEPLAPGTVVTARLDLPSVGLIKNKPYKITGVEMKRQISGCDWTRYFYSIDGTTHTILLEYIQLAGPVCTI